MKQTDFEALDALVTACEAEFTNVETEDPNRGCEDRESVALGKRGPGPITFGHIRRARAAIDAAKARHVSSFVYTMNGVPLDPCAVGPFPIDRSPGVFSEAKVWAGRENISVIFANGSSLKVDFNPPDPLRGFTEHCWIDGVRVESEHADDALPYQAAGLRGANADGPMTAAEVERRRAQHVADPAADAAGPVFPDFDPNRMVRSAYEGLDVDVDDESWDDLEALLAERLPDLHSCGRSELLGAIVDNWLPKLLARAPAPAASQAVNDVIAERTRQVVVEGFTAEHDDTHVGGEMARAAMCYIWAALLDPRARDLCAQRAYLDGTDCSRWWAYNFLYRNWPFDRAWFKPTTPRRDLVKGLALGLAELERLDRIADAAEMRAACEGDGGGEGGGPSAAALADAVAATLVFMPTKQVGAIRTMIEAFAGVNGPGWAEEWLKTPHDRLGGRKPLDDLVAAMPLMAAIIHGLPA